MINYQTIMVNKQHPHRTMQVGVSLLSAIILVLVLCGFSQAADPSQEWLYLTVVGPHYNGGEPLALVITKDNRKVDFAAIKDFSHFTYDFFGYTGDRTKFNFLKEVFGIYTIRPDQIGDLFGVPVTITYAYVWNQCERKVRTMPEIVHSLNNGCIRQNAVTLKIVE